ncbi:MAG: HAMP domain-containing protein [Lachnospiraceae bacterium]|nr:HAMP domain-containing protein [Lachnospiraceae bacterium]
MKVRKISIFNQLFICLVALLLLGNGALGISVYNRSESSLFGQIQSNARNIAVCAAANVSGDILEQIESGDEASAEYDKIVEELALFRDNAELEYIYTLRQREDGEFIFVVDSDLEEPASIGDICEKTDALCKAYEEGNTVADDEAFADEWGNHVSAYSPIYNGNKIVGVVGVDISANWIEEQITMLRNLVIIVCVITYVLSLVILQFLMLRFKRSMGKLNDKVKELAGGSGDLTKEIDIYTGDELEVIAGNMNIFIRQIRSLVKDVAQSTENILVTGEDLSTTVSNNIQIMSNMNGEIEDISTNMEMSSASSNVLSENLAESAGHIAEFAENVNDICRMVQQANENAQKTSAMAKENRKNALDSIHRMQKKIEDTSKDAQQIEKVKQIAEEIGSIAGQTRILSLNAQIEAARAGVAGAGFAVVATKVGVLSNDIDQAVTEINAINSQVLTAVGALSEASEEMIRFVSEDVVKDYDAFADLGEEYGSTTDAIRVQMTQIGEQSEHISRNISNINTDVSQIASTVTSTAESANNLAQSTNQIAESLESLNIASQKNTQHSEKLGAQIEKYKF